MNTLRPLSRRTTQIAVVAALAAVTLLVPSSRAQTPESGAMGATHPVHIHSGTCATLGDVVFPLTDMAAPAGEPSGPTSAVPITESETIVDAPLQEIIDGGHAINVHLSSEEIGTYIACGDLGGVVGDEGGRQQIAIGLAELNGSGYTGVAWLGASEDGKQTEVAVIILEPAAS